MTDSGDRFFPSIFLDPAEIYRQLTEGSGPSDLQRIQAQLQFEAPEEEDRAGLIASLGELVASGWQGQASAAAYGATLALRDRVNQNADNVERAQDLLSRQLGSFSTAYNSVRPVSAPPEQPLDEPFPFDVDHAKEVAAYQADAQHNIAVFQQYDGASEYNETNMPQEFRAGGRDGGDVSVRVPDTIEVGEPRPGGGGPGEPRPGGGEPRDGSPGGGRPEGGRGPGGGPGGSGGFPGAGPSSGGGSGVGGGGPSGAGGFTETSGVSPSGGSPAGGGDSRPGRGVAGDSSLAGSGGPGGFVGGGSGGGAPRGGGAGSGPALRGPGGSVGVGGLAAEENAVRRGVVAGGSRGGGGAFGAPLGAGRSQGDEDVEHERKVLIEGDSEEMFGSDVLTAPQVIGDDEYED